MSRKLHITEMNRLDIGTYKERKKIPLTILLDNVRSMNNIGSIFRTADAFRIERMILCGITAVPPHPMIHKTALGAEESVEWEYSPSILDRVLALKAEGYEIWALELATHSLPPEQSLLQKNQKVALVIGNEVHGVSDEVIALADRCIEIPQYGTKHSLNVSVSTGIALYTLVSPLLSSLED
ncbi:RNA methyltransferase [Porphyromonas circumdentaria]|uniref:SpoU rRNA Methylase family protein n=1 Tax=Porphyromonas circumdentaria TaxID=29524 RepID=A0A1T4KVL2_9PORP|nr:RNA methyltransferase [Porphyromonas circumdentaria]MBB6275091.1 tRNA G18 (ribose-2'-O)-methylase SpoU [Porphyromonas circumdentaria]SJZ46403.1 SpoU rRNA Methylase family protein [Porphyromonas circumdentaria]